ncbi:MAG: aminomethyl-transferring glycine dehydrogenase subunit GcvPA [Bacillota bacterium]|nr:aminomethyl-transferring glycine dehydrogenase subunit GcvPA [Bacillota bacterium]
MADYVPNTSGQQKAMLAAIGCRSMEDLFLDIPAEVRLKKPLDLPPPLSELELSAELRRIAALNGDLDRQCCFLGAGAYDHYVPAAVKNLTARQEFYTAYTPYQPEISQGTLQAIFEFQTMICELTGMDLANASMYDGASALAEAALMACNATRRKRILVAGNLHPDNMAVLKTYTWSSGLTLDRLAWDAAAGSVSLDDLEHQIDDETAAVLVQSPNFFGIIEALPAIAELAHQHKALFIVSCDPIALGILQSPGEAGADIVVGDGQALGNGLNYGGPYLGFFAARQDLMRRMPGRIVGETKDARGRRSYVLTIQTREQHIRREKATSNICTNQALNALTATIYLALMGPAGLARVAELSTHKAHNLYSRLIQVPGFEPVFSGSFFKEFAVRYCGDIDSLNQYLLRAGFIGGLKIAAVNPDVSDCWLLAVTEKRTEEEIDRLIAAIRCFGEEKGVLAE